MPPRNQALTALYVRIPSAIATEIDRVAETKRQAKQQVVSDILRGALDAASSGVRAGAVTGGAAPGFVTPGFATALEPTMDLVLTLHEAAELLRVTDDDVLTCVRESALPGRRIGEAWRFSCRAVLAWLGETAPAGKPAPGFAGSSKATKQ